MAQQKKPISIANFLKDKISNLPIARNIVDVLGYTPDEDIDDPVNGMKSDINPDDDWGRLGGTNGPKVISGINVYSDSEKALNEKEDLKLKEKLQKFADDYGLKLQYNILYGNYTLKDAQGTEKYQFEKNGNLKYTGYDLVGQQYKDIVKISAGQFKNNKKIAYPFVAENNPKIPDSMQEANLRLTIETLMEEGVSIERIRLKSKKWGHLIDEYKNKEELKNEDFLNASSGIDERANPSQAPPANEPVAKSEATENKADSDDKELEKIEEVSADYEKTEPKKGEGSNRADNKENYEVKKPDDAPAYNEEDERLRLKKALLWSLNEAHGDMELLISQNKNFHKDNFEISFTKNGELVTVSNVRPNPDGNIQVINAKTENLTKGKVYASQMEGYYNVVNAQKAQGSLNHILQEAVTFTKGDYPAFREKMLEDKSISWGFTADEKHLFASKETENGDIEFGKVSLAKGEGIALIESKKGLLKKAANEDKLDGYTDNFDDLMFGSGGNGSSGEDPSSSTPPSKPKSSKPTI